MRSSSSSSIVLLLAVTVPLGAACSKRKAEPPPGAGSPVVSAPPPAPSPAADEVASRPSALAPLDPPAAPGAIAPSLARGRRGLLATWVERAEGENRVRLARLGVDGRWGKPTTIASGPKVLANWADFPSAAEAADGTLVAHWLVRTEGMGYDAHVGRSRDGGKTWEGLGALHDDRTLTEHGFVSLVPEGDGVRAFWLDGREMKDGGEASGAMTVRTLMVGSPASRGEVLDARVCSCCSTSATATPDGPLLVYRDRTDDELRDTWVVRRAAKGWTEPRPVHVDGWKIAGCPVNGPTVVADGARVAVAWYTMAAGPRVLLAWSTDGGMTFGAPIEVDATRGRRVPLGRVDLAVAPGGDAIVAWLASEREGAQLVARRVAPDGRVGSEIVVTTTRADRDSGFPQLERLGDALVFAWTEPGAPSRVRAARLPVADVPPATAAPTASTPASASAAPAGLAVGAPAPALEAHTLDGRQVRLKALRGRPVLVNLWATWCEPCRHELPILARLYERHRARGLEVVALSVDQERTRAEVAEFATRRKLPFAVWHDPEDRASTAFGIANLPASFLLDAQGKIVWRRLGAVTAEDAELERAVVAALAVDAARQPVR